MTDLTSAVNGPGAAPATKHSPTEPAAGHAPVRVAITAGDAAGIGPEIIVRALDQGAAAGRRIVVVGPAAVLHDASRRWAPRLRWAPWGMSAAPGSAGATPVAPGPAGAASVAGGPAAAPVVELLDTGGLTGPPPFGRVSAQTGEAAARAIRQATALALRGEVDAVCTAPIHKESLAAAGVPYPGHTEMLAAQSGADDIAMMLVCPGLRTMLVTIHCSLREAIDRVRRAEVLRIIRLADRTLRRIGIARPRIAVAGLNPHAGEGGLFGREDIDEIAPAVADAVALGIDAAGPLPGDTVFVAARRGRFDLVVAQYHDQGLIPVKLIGMEDGVNVTAGLPFVRTSPDHGTAFDIAGRGIADPSSLKAALALAVELAEGRPADAGQERDGPVPSP